MAAGRGAAVETIAACRSCGASTLEPALDLGESPIADRLQDCGERPEHAPRVPLEVVLCTACGLAQLRHTVPREALFDDRYPYLSSSSPTLLAHAHALARSLVERRSLGPDSFVVELASNDGYLLRCFADLKLRALGVDPAGEPVRRARDAGLQTLQAFFDSASAQSILSEHGPADVIVANNVLAHVADVNDVVHGMQRLLAANGVISVEVPYLADMMERCEFDTIYHQHLCYFSVSALDALFRRHGLGITSIRRLDIHGGSLRLEVERGRHSDGSVESLMESERTAGLGTSAAFEGFAERVRRVRDQLRALLEGIARRGGRVAGYAASAKGTTLLSYCGIDASTLEFVVDRNRFKHGQRMPGAGIPIEPVTLLVERQPDYALLLAWNFAGEILAQQAEYRRRGGRFIVPVPRPAIV
jgi:SAM-dependent methyltransferase